MIPSAAATASNHTLRLLPTLKVIAMGLGSALLLLAAFSAALRPRLAKKDPSVQPAQACSAAQQEDYLQLRTAFLATRNNVKSLVFLAALSSNHFVLQGPPKRTSLSAARLPTCGLGHIFQRKLHPSDIQELPSSKYTSQDAPGNEFNATSVLIWCEIPSQVAHLFLPPFSEKKSETKRQMQQGDDEDVNLSYQVRHHGLFFSFPETFPKPWVHLEVASKSLACRAETRSPVIYGIPEPQVALISGTAVAHTSNALDHWWLRHQLNVVRADHVFIYAHPSWRPSKEMQQLMRDYSMDVDVIPWEPTQPRLNDHYFSRHLAFTDMVLRFKSASEYFYASSFDDFLWMQPFPSHSSKLSRSNADTAVPPGLAVFLDACRKNVRGCRSAVTFTLPSYPAIVRNANDGMSQITSMASPTLTRDALHEVFSLYTAASDRQPSRSVHRLAHIAMVRSDFGGVVPILARGSVQFALRSVCLILLFCMLFVNQSSSLRKVIHGWEIEYYGTQAIVIALTIWTCALAEPWDWEVGSGDALVLRVR